MAAERGTYIYARCPYIPCGARAQRAAYIGIVMSFSGAGTYTDLL